MGTKWVQDNQTHVTNGKGPVQRDYIILRDRHCLVLMTLAVITPFQHFARFNFYKF